jgi:gliding motility-associated protein GldL
MVKIRKYANVIERFLHGQKGQRFFNFAYSIGAAIVIWGALFKILHLPGGSTLLCIGMGTEIAMFILTAFDRPPKDYAWEEVFPVLDSHDADQRPDFSTGGGIVINGGMAGSNEEYQPQQGVAGGGVQGAVAPTLPYTGLTEEDADSLHESIVKMAAASEQLSRMAELTTATQDYLAQISSISEQMQRLSQTTEALNQVSDVLLNSYTAITNNSDRINENSNGYVAQMEDLNRNIGGLNTIYEIQLKSISSQLESIDRVNRGLKDIRDMYEKSAHESSRYCEETERMARYMRQLNQVYEKMITAMTVNMANPMMGGVQQNPFNNNEAGNNL